MKPRTPNSKPSARSAATLADQMAAAADLARQSAVILAALAERNRRENIVRTLPAYPLSDLIDALNELSDAYDDFGETYGFKKYSRIIDYHNDHDRRVAERAQTDQSAP